MIVSAARPHRLHPRPLGQHDRPQPIDGRVELVVDDHVLVLRELADLAAGDLEPPADLLLAVLAAAAQPLLEDGRRRRQHEDADGLDAAAAHLPRALHVDDEHDVLARAPGTRSVSAAQVP